MLSSRSRKRRGTTRTSTSRGAKWSFTCGPTRSTASRKATSTWRRRSTGCSTACRRGSRTMDDGPWTILAYAFLVHRPREPCPLEGACMELNISGRVAMVAAASKGIGKAVALGLAEEGCRVSICGRNPETLEEARRDIESYIGPTDVFALPADVSNPEDLQQWFNKTVDRFGTVDILVTNTGGPPAAKFMALSDEQWL